MQGNMQELKGSAMVIWELKGSAMVILEFRGSEIVIWKLRGSAMVILKLGGSAGGWIYRNIEEVFRKTLKSNVERGGK